ncbi:Initiator tRNA phosphoribosyl transferase [Corchorus olitorius]|uniref:Initiator tRNA phosphoribosyl transferase n=1 Tax=Corchorus olitorius TaxID=93759 RepID=A0A1R3GJU2_9ROSI|nr:Initiator tRNA phosphoribosyl transferase [Corchorus olitorius]
MENEAKLSIYRAARTIKRKENTVYNALRSIYEDSIFVGEISQLWPQLPLVANLRCGLWYSPKFHSTCYFKSTDGHNNNWSFNTSRLNFHIALLAGQKGGCIIVDSTRRGKRFPDSMSKTIPIWTCVLNRSISNYLNNNNNGSSMEESDMEQKSVDWDCSLHLPLWVSGTEKAAIEERLEGWTKDLEASGADIAALASCLKKPLRPLWISQRTVIWINEVPDYDSWDFTPIILLSASLPSGVPQHRTTSEFSWNYIPGAGDDEESWARGLSPNLFWNHAYDLISSGPDLCNQKVADMVEKDRVYRAQRGQNAPQITAKPSISESSPNPLSVDPLLCSDLSNLNVSSSDEESGIYWLGNTNLALSSFQVAENATNVDCILNCDQRSIIVRLPEAEAYLHLPILLRKVKAYKWENTSWEDISVSICLAILISLYNDEGSFDGGKSFSETGITKSEMRRRLVYICKFAIKARPSRGNLRQVFNFLNNSGNQK